ncbi:HupE/UreJ family protein [Actinoplanes sp. CA-142083]|uniref:HupE/UreJ family protein n=1 Tax=Actinoplanes sp. CA-142083 TaxID=3239903 RepID=UPI003D8FC9DD
MPPIARRAAVVAAAVTACLLAAPDAAHAHGIGGTSETWYGFIWLGVKHMLLGWDHLLFVGGVALIAADRRRAAQMISLFALGHSITLFTATVAGWHVNPVLVDVVVALSLVFVGVIGVLGRPVRWRWFGAAVFGFGLIHGVGLATRLQDLGLPSDGVIPRVLAFNLGVEIGQLTALLVMVLLVAAVVRYLPGKLQPRVALAALAVVGVAAAGLLTVTAITEPAPAAEAVGQNCQVQKRTDTYPAGGGHPAKDFFEPAEQPPAKSFGHVVGDGYVIVHYAPNLPAEQLDQLRAFVTDPASGRVVGGPAAGQTQPVKAVHAFQTQLACTSFDLAALRQFAADWFADPRSKPAE